MVSVTWSPEELASTTIALNDAENRLMVARKPLESLTDLLKGCEERIAELKGFLPSLKIFQPETPRLGSAPRRDRKQDKPSEKKPGRAISNDDDESVVEVSPPQAPVPVSMPSKRRNQMNASQKKAGRATSRIKIESDDEVSPPPVSSLRKKRKRGKIPPKQPSRVVADDENESVVEVSPPQAPAPITPPSKRRNQMKASQTKISSASRKQEKKPVKEEGKDENLYNKYAGLFANSARKPAESARARKPALM